MLNARVSEPGDGTALLEMLGPAQAHATTEKSKVFRASISVEFDNGRHVHAEVVFRLKDQAITTRATSTMATTDQGDKDEGGKDRNDEPYEMIVLAGRFRWSDAVRVRTARDCLGFAPHPRVDLDQ